LAVTITYEIPALHLVIQPMLPTPVEIFEFNDVACGKVVQGILVAHGLVNNFWYRHSNNSNVDPREEMALKARQRPENGSKRSVLDGAWALSA
jgi:hypothetical protein